MMQNMGDSSSSQPLWVPGNDGVEIDKHPNIDPTQLVFADHPPEWGVIPDEVVAQLAPQAVTVVQGPQGKEYIWNTSGILTPTQKAELDKIARSRWFLLRNDGPVADRLRCGRCKKYHAYFTLACVERPFHGLQEMLALIHQKGGDPKINDLLLGRYIKLGTIVPITRRDALVYIRRIRMKNEVI